jgi:hypothetical protein
MAAEATRKLLINIAARCTAYPQIQGGMEISIRIVEVKKRQADISAAEAHTRRRTAAFGVSQLDCYTSLRRDERPIPWQLGRKIGQRKQSRDIACDRRTSASLGGQSQWPDSSVVERGPEKAGVGGSIPSLATTLIQLEAKEWSHR